jgi:hypothetical protein
MRNVFAFLIAFALLLGLSGEVEAEKTKYTKAKFVIKVVQATKADKEEIPPELKDFGDALKDAAENMNVFKQLKSFDVTAEFSKGTEQELGIHEYKAKLEPTEYEKDELKVTVSMIKIDGKKSKVLARSKLAMAEGGIVCFDMGAYNGGTLLVALKFVKVE